jgi:signal transduction histidine kinase
MDDVAARVWPLVERARVDRAARETLEMRVAERTAELRETLTELESFSYSVSHDLRAPLRAMQSYAAIMASEYGASLDTAGKEFIRRIVTAGERMDRLIQDVLVYSRVARNEMPLERIELGSFIAGVLESYPQFDPFHSRVELVLPLAPVRANPTALTQCISNLVGNAIKFVAPDVKPHIRIWTDMASDAKVRLYFADNGIGIPGPAQEKVFGIFYQEDPRHGGTGIALAVVRKAAQRMGGAISVESEPGKGSTFCLELNAAQES